MMMINHITLLVSNFEESKKFFIHALQPLGYRLLKIGKNLQQMYEGKFAGFGIKGMEGERDFWINEGGKKQKHHSFSCLAFTASSKKIVDDFYKAALQVGGKDNGAPGYRKKYHPGYYAAYVLDLDGHNIEVVFDDPNPPK